MVRDPLLLKEYRRKIKKNLNEFHIILQLKISVFGNNAWQSTFTFSLISDIIWNLLPCPSNDFPLYSQQQMRYLKHYERGVFRHLFPAHLPPRLEPSQGPPEFITEHQSTESFHNFNILNNFADTQSVPWNGHVLYVVHQ